MTSRCHTLTLALLLGFCGPAWGKTIILTDIDCERMAFIPAAWWDAMPSPARHPAMSAWFQVSGAPARRYTPA